MSAAKSPKYWQHIAVSPGYPSQVLFDFCIQNCKMREIRVCSTEDHPCPQLLKNMKEPMTEWKGGVQIFFSIQDYPRTEEWWESTFHNMGMVPVRNVERIKLHRGQLWAIYADKYTTRSIELHENVMIFNIANSRLNAKPTPAPVEEAKQPAQEEPAVAQDKAELLVAMSAEERHTYVVTQCEAEDDRVLVGQPKKAKAKKCLKSKKAPEVPADEVAGGPRVPLTLTEKMNLAASGGLHADQWQAMVRLFLTKSDVYSGGANAEDNIVVLMRRILPESCKSIPFFSTRSKTGVGMLFPGPYSSEARSARPYSSEARSARPFTPTVELHRAALALERDAEAMLRVVAAEVEKRGPVTEWGPFFSESDPAFVPDLQAALLAKGGVSGGGSRYWAKSDAPLPNLGPETSADGPLASWVAELAVLRPAAFYHRYVIADQNTWGLSMLVTIIGVKNEFAHIATLGGSSRQEQAHNFQYKIEALNKYRRQALEVDQAPLIKYGALLSRYTARLAHFAAVFGVERVADSRLVNVFQSLTVTPLHGANDIIQDMIARENLELDALLGQLYLPERQALAVLRIREVNAGIIDALRNDSHLTQATMHLFPSHHLPYAKYNPGKYAPI